MGELHLEILIDRMKREFNVDANVGRPQVVYRETITDTVQMEGKFIRQSGGKGQYGHVVVIVSPAEKGAGLMFEDKITGGVIPREYISSCRKGAEDAMNSGAVAGYPIVDIRVELIDGSYHEVDSSDIAFRIATSMAVNDAVKKASPVLLEPIMRVEVVTPQQYSGDVLGDLNMRRGRIENIENRSDAQVISGHIPLAEMFGYATRLRSLTQGRAIYTMEFESYFPVSDSLAKEIKERTGQ